MKPHLPKALLAAVLAACFFSSQAAYAATGWGEPLNFSGAAYYIDSATVSEIDATAKTETTIGIFNDDSSSTAYDATVTTLKLKSGDTLKLEANQWHTDNFFAPLRIENLEVADGGSASIVNAAGSALELQGISGSLTGLENSGTLNITSNVTMDLLHGGTGSITFGDGATAGTAVIQRIEVGDHGVAAETSLTVNENYVLKITGTNNGEGAGAYKTNAFTFGEWVASTTVTVKGILMAESGKLLSGDTGGVINVEGTVATKGLANGKAGAGSYGLNMSAGSRLILGDGGINVGHGFTSNLQGGTIGLSADAAITNNLTVNGAVTFDTTKYAFAENGIEQGTEGGKLTLSGNLDGAGAVSVTGNGTLATGNNTIGTDFSIANGATLEFVGTISMGEGKTLTFEAGAIITLGDGLSADNFLIDGSASYTNYEGGNANNGFVQSATAILVSGGAIAGTATLEYNGSSFTIDNDHRTFSFDDAGASGSYFLNEGTADLSKINAMAASGNPIPVEMAAGTTLNMDAALASGQSLVVNGNSTAAIAQGVSLSSANVTANNGAVLTLTGAGEYNNGANGTKNPAIAFGDGWTGNAIVDSARGVTNFNIDSFAKINADGSSASTVTLKGVSGYLQQANQGDGVTHYANLILQNTAYAALEITDGWSGDHNIFAGTISGSGNFIHNKDLGAEDPRNRVTFEFTNDVSGWTGKLENIKGISTFRFTGDAATINNLVIQNRNDNSSNNKMDLEFIHDKAATVNSRIEKSDTTSEGSRVTVKVENSSEAGTTFTHTVNVSKIDVTDGSKASFTGTTTTGELTTGTGSTLSGTVTVSGTATLNGLVEKGSAIAWTGADAKTLTLNTEYDAGNSILTTIATGSTINFMTDGRIDLGASGGHSSDLGGKNLTLTATITLDGNAADAVATRWLIAGNSIWYRDNWSNNTENSLVNFETFTITESTGKELTRYANAGSLDDAWTSYGETATAALGDPVELGAGAYRYVATADGIGVQYYQKSVPEPATATLSLLALAALAARRRRKA